MKDIKKLAANYAMIKTLSKLFKDRDLGEVDDENFVIIFNAILASGIRAGADSELTCYLFEYINLPNLTDEDLGKLRELINISETRLDKLERDTKMLDLKMKMLKGEPLITIDQ